MWISKHVFEQIIQLTLGPNAVERLQQYRSKQLLRRNRRPTETRIKQGEVAAHGFERFVGHQPDHPKWPPW